MVMLLVFSSGEDVMSYVIFLVVIAKMLVIHHSTVLVVVLEATPERSLYLHNS